jgi:ketosteroid isomerase-like protein
MGFQVLGCTARDLMLQVFGDTAVVSHAVETRQRMEGKESTAHERETIVLRKQDDGRWLAIHEHLSEDETPLEGSAD